MTTTESPKRRVWMNLLTGGISGAISRTLTNPLERVKVVKQVNIPEYIGKSTLNCLRFMTLHEGLGGLMKGNGTNVARIAPFSACEFFFYEVFKNNLMPKDNPNSQLGKFFCGGLTGIAANFFTYPLDLIRTRITV